MIKSLTIGAALAGFTATAAMAQYSQPSLKPIPKVEVAPSVQAAPEPPRAIEDRSRGYYRDSDGKWTLYSGCHWVDPNNNSDLRTYCK
jgi:hypothetical protein